MINLLLLFSRCLAPLSEIILVANPDTDKEVILSNIPVDFKEIHQAVEYHFGEGLEVKMDGKDVPPEGETHPEDSDKSMWVIFVVMKDYISKAFKENRVDAVDQFIQKGHTVKPELLEKACAQGKLDMVKLLIQHTTEFYPSGMLMAARTGHYEVVKFLLQKLPEATLYTKAAITRAERGGQEQIINLLRAAAEKHLQHDGRRGPNHKRVDLRNMMSEFDDDREKIADLLRAEVDLLELVENPRTHRIVLDITFVIYNCFKNPDADYVAHALEFRLKHTNIDLEYKPKYLM